MCVSVQYVMWFGVTLSLQSALEQLVSEYQQLNQALRAEKKLYQNLNHVQSIGDRLGPEMAGLDSQDLDLVTGF